MKNPPKYTRGPWTENQRENSSKTSFKKGFTPWNKGKTCPTISAAIDTEQRRQQMLLRWQTDQEYIQNTLALLDKDRSARRIAQLETHGDDCRCAMHNPYPYKRTPLELILIAILESVYPVVIPEKIFGKSKVDAYVPSSHIAFEADGSHWHQDKVWEEQRDQYLQTKFGLLVIHVGQDELLQWSNILD